MPLRTPKYRLHKGSGQALVQINGERVYLGKYGTEESKERYRKTIAEWLASGHPTGRRGSPSAAATQVTANELILAFSQHAKERYVKNGEPTREIRSFKTALRPVRQLYGHEPAAAFGPLALVACRQKLIEAGICRKRINQHVPRIRHVFKWGVARELVPETVWRALCAVEGLRVGEAIETAPVKPVPEEHVVAIEPFVTPQIRAMVNLQLWTACGPADRHAAANCFSNSSIRANAAASCLSNSATRSAKRTQFRHRPRRIFIMRQSTRYLHIPPTAIHRAVNGDKKLAAGSLGFVFHFKGMRSQPRSTVGYRK